jgi:hypothetical protein
MQFTMLYRQKPVKTAIRSNYNRFAADFQPGSAVNWIGGQFDGGGGTAYGGRAQTFHVGNESFGTLWSQFGN